jgi:hypothetical protein
MLCDQPQPTTAAILTYNATGFSFNGSALLADGPGWCAYCC